MEITMRILNIAGLATIALLIHTALPAENGPCSSIAGPSILVKVVGLKNRAGTIRIRVFGGDPKTYFDKKHALKRIEFDAPNSGTVERCIAVAKAGTYAIDVRHDTNSNGKSDKADGAGVSGNPEVSLLDVMLKKRPPARKVQVNVSGSATAVAIIVKYLSGGKLKPA